MKNKILENGKALLNRLGGETILGIKHRLRCKFCGEQCGTLRIPFWKDATKHLQDIVDVRCDRCTSERGTFREENMNRAGRRALAKSV